MKLGISSGPGILRPSSFTSGKVYSRNDLPINLKGVVVKSI
jgi:hypothetical protein